MFFSFRQLFNQLFRQLFEQLFSQLFRQLFEQLFKHLFGQLFIQLTLHYHMQKCMQRLGIHRLQTIQRIGLLIIQKHSQVIVGLRPIQVTCSLLMMMLINMLELREHIQLE